MNPLMNPWIWLGVFIIVCLAVLAVYLMYDNVSRRWRKKITMALKTWSQTDEYLEQQSKLWLKIMLNSIDDLLEYPENLAASTQDKIEDLRRRIEQIARKRGI